MTKTGTAIAVQEASIKTDRDGLVKCRVCGCTEREACNPPCGWARGEFDLCTLCAEVSRVVLHWQGAARRPNMTALLREVERKRAGVRMGVFATGGAK